MLQIYIEANILRIDEEYTPARLYELAKMDEEYKYISDFAISH